MSIGRPSTLQVPLILLAIVSLGVLAARLWPWHEVLNLPENGTAGIDPVISLAGYILLFMWIGSVRQVGSRRALASGVAWGFAAGLALVAQILLAGRPGSGGFTHPGTVSMILFGVTILFWGIVGLRTARSEQTFPFSVLCSAWAAMVSSLMACTAVLAQAYFAAGLAETPDPWKQYEGLAIGTPATQSLVHSLNTATGFLLIGPIVGGIAGLLFAGLGMRRKNSAT